MIPQLWPWLGRVSRKPKQWYVQFRQHLLSHTFISFCQLPVHHLHSWIPWNILTETMYTFHLVCSFPVNTSPLYLLNNKERIRGKARSFTQFDNTHRVIDKNTQSFALLMSEALSRTTAGTSSGLSLSYHPLCREHDGVVSTAAAIITHIPWINAGYYPNPRGVACTAKAWQQYPTAQVALGWGHLHLKLFLKTSVKIWGTHTWTVQIKERGDFTSYLPSQLHSFQL